MLVAIVAAVLLALTYAAWRRYLWAAEEAPCDPANTCPYSLRDVFGDRHQVNVPHQEGVQWLTEIFTRSARTFPDLTALQIPHTGESLTFAELDAAAEKIACEVARVLTGPDQVVAVAMPQDNWQIVAAHLGILKAGGTLMFIDTSLPDGLITHMLNDAQPALVLTRGQDSFRDLPTLDVLGLPEQTLLRENPAWLDDPGQRLAAIFYTSGTTGLPKGVECPHAGYVNLALSYADYFDLLPGMDATSLSSSMGYDGSISEMYSAWVSGCAVVMLTGEQLRSGPALIPILCEAEVTVLFCPPLLLSTLTTQPHIDLPNPICRYIVPAGEAFPSALVAPWTRGRRQIINTYGPTEASTDTSRQSLRPGEPVTIGSPMANVTYVVLAIGQLEALPHGEVGELCIGGVHLARGYRNLPEQTAEKFITHPQFGRLYRTGDKCRIDARTQRVHFLGRTDTQLKVRGHRVETQAIEDILQTQVGEIEAAVVDYQNEQLVAFVRAPSITRTGGTMTIAAPEKWATEVSNLLARQLPEPAIPSHILLVDKFLTKPLSGKVDRERLPRLSDTLKYAGTRTDPGNDSGTADSSDTPQAKTPPPEPEPGMEPGCKEVLTICQEVLEAPVGWDSIFVEHGGHSINIARLAQRLHGAGWSIPVRALLSDCNTARKVIRRAPRMRLPRAAPGAPSPRVRNTNHTDKPAARVLSAKLFTTLQVLFLCLLYLPALVGFLGVIAFAEIGELFISADYLAYIVVGALLYLVALLSPFATLLWVLLIKLLMGGHPSRNRVPPGSYPKWSRMHLRVWCIGRLQNSVLVPIGALFRSAPLMSYVLRRLGARVGSNLQCAHDVEFSGPLDLLAIGDDVAIQTGAYVHTCRWHGRNLHIGPVSLETDCKIGMRAAISEDVTVGRGSRISPFTPILTGVGEQEMWEGAPARFDGHCVQLTRTGKGDEPGQAVIYTETLNILMQVFLDFCLFVLPAVAVSWFAATFIPVAETATGSDYFRVTPLPEIMLSMGIFAFAATWVTIVLTSVLVCLFLRCTPASPGIYLPGEFKSNLLLYRMRKMNQLQKRWTWTITGQYLRALAGVRFSRLGASECDLMVNLVPELASADARVFWSNGCFSNMLDQNARYIELRQLDMPRNFFSGTNCVIESGQFPSNFLLGVSTPGNDIQFRRQMRSRPGAPISVAGNPAVKFASTAFEAEHERQRLPGFFLFLARVLLNDIVSIGMLPMAGLLIYVILYTTCLRLGGNPVLSGFLTLVFVEVCLVLLCAMIKKFLVGRTWGSRHSTPFWSWQHFSYFFAQDCFFAWCRSFLGLTAGTVLANPALRMMGCRIGKGTLIGSPLQASDWNAVSIGADCVINGLLQFHTFENMTLKIKRTDIQDGSVINFGATIMGGAVIEAEASLLPLSLVLKEMHLDAATPYWGSPCEPRGDC